MLKGDTENILGTGLSLILYENLGYPKGKSIKGLYKWYNARLGKKIGRITFRKLNRQFAKDLVKGKIREKRMLDKS